MTNMNSKQNTHTNNRAIIVCLSILTLLGFTSGCMDLKGALNHATAWRDHASEVEAALQTQLDTLETKRKITPDDSPDAPALDALIAITDAKVQSLDALIAQADQIINEATNPSDSLTIATNAISPWVPAPAQGPLILGAALIASLVRSKNLKNSATSIIRSIDHTMSRDPVFRDLFAMHADTIRTIQTPSARKLIDRTINKSSKPILSP